MRYPNFINEGDTIGFVAPAFGCTIEPYRSAFENARKKFEERGFSCYLGENCFSDNGIGISNTPEKCAEEFMQEMDNKENACLISCGGGELMCEIVPYLDFERLRQIPPKWFMGYSDNTNAAFLLATLSDTAAIYGPCAPTFGMEPWHEALEDALSLLKGEKLTVTNYKRWEIESRKDEEHPLEPYNLTEPFAMKVFLPNRGLKNGTANISPVTGRLIGGCLDCLANLVGTSYDKVKEFEENYREDGLIWFLEACDLNVFSIRRALWNLREAGWFDTAKAFLIGRPMHFNEPMFDLDQYEAVIGILGELNVPVYMDLDIGHTAPMMPLICGAMATVEVGDNSIFVKMRTE